jgi:hypothetical protein
MPAPTKQCWSCHTTLFLATSVCNNCGELQANTGNHNSDSWCNTVHSVKAHNPSSSIASRPVQPATSHKKARTNATPRTASTAQNNPRTSRNRINSRLNSSDREFTAPEVSEHETHHALDVDGSQHGHTSQLQQSSDGWELYINSLRDSPHVVGKYSPTPQHMSPAIPWWAMRKTVLGL